MIADFAPRRHNLLPKRRILVLERLADGEERRADVVCLQNIQHRPNVLRVIAVVNRHRNFLLLAAAEAISDVQFVLCQRTPQH